MPRRVRLLACMTVLAGCSITEPEPSKGTIEVLTREAVYQPLDIVVVDITNNTDRPIFNDMCGGSIEGNGMPGLGWNGSYGAARICIDVSPPTSWRRIEPGVTLADSLHVNSRAYAGEWRMQLFLRDSRGDLLPLVKRISNTFEVEADWRP